MPARKKKPAPSATRFRRVLHLDTFSGMAGNMFLGALLDAGLSAKALRDGLAGLGVDHRLRVSRVKRGAIAARYVTVSVPKGGHEPHRHWSDIRRLLDRAKLAPAVRERAQAIFAALAEAEGKVHGIPPEKVHFHEVGAVDAIVDITGAALALELLGIERVTATPPALGHGTVQTEHGLLPVPPPATLELLRGIPTVPSAEAFETLTPTGAAILRVVVDEFRQLPAMTPEVIGYGAGNDRKTLLPNVVRAVLGREVGFGHDRVVVLEANLDDLVPEHFDHIMARLLAAGALDVGIQASQTKKNRPGFLLRVVADPAARLDLAGRILRETTTLGVRVSEAERLTLPRRAHTVPTPYGPIRVKISERPDGKRDVSAEYDDCRRAAERHDVPLRDVIRAAEDTAVSTS
jgi:uncharacterized protein (TIGR00299 family) protein